MATVETPHLRGPLTVPADDKAVGAMAHHRWMLPSLLAGQAIAAMNTSIANVAAPVLRDDLGISGALLQMVVAGYVLAYAVLLITGARLGDDYGYRRLFLIGGGLFAATPLLLGRAPGASRAIRRR